MVYKVKKLILLIVLHTFLMSVALSCIFPLLWMINASFKNNIEFKQDYGLSLAHRVHFSNYIRVFKEAKIGVYFFNSVFYTFITVLSIVLISSLAAYGFSRLEFNLSPQKFEYNLKSFIMNREKYFFTAIP